MNAPTDSVLKRHYEQMMGRKGKDNESAPDSSSSSLSDQGGQGSGLFGWLKKLFCG